MDPSVTLFGPVDTYLAPVLIYVLLALVVVNMASRGLEHRRIAARADEDGAEAVSRNPLRVATNFLLVLAAFYFLTVERHAGMIVTLLVLGVFLSDFFEFESRKVEARQGWELDRPWASIWASLTVLAYVLYHVFAELFPFWNAVI